MAADHAAEHGDWQQPAKARKHALSRHDASLDLILDTANRRM
jgi:hypothetical protein